MEVNTDTANIKGSHVNRITTNTILLFFRILVITIVNLYAVRSMQLLVLL